MKPIYLIAGGVGLFLLMNKINATKNAVDGLKVFVTNPAKPRVSNGMLLIDVMVNVSNASSQTLPIQAMQVSAFRQSGNAWVEFASSTPDLTNIVFKPFQTTRFPVTMQTSLLTVGMEVFEILMKGGSGKFKFSVSPTFMGVKIPPITTDVFEFNAGAFIPKGTQKA
ncbi:hypothetical protein ACFS7Z_13820 [Pontibacter toksunensis]|uniref:Late embryogenesis abundant protein n=1 Tax=Pontibacter toksunensis TaxID=1332631 RepID=A0ABW6BUG8_9BACT